MSNSLDGLFLYVIKLKKSNTKGNSLDGLFLYVIKLKKSNTKGET